MKKVNGKYIIEVKTGYRDFFRTLAGGLAVGVPLAFGIGTGIKSLSGQPAAPVPQVSAPQNPATKPPEPKKPAEPEKPAVVDPFGGNEHIKRLYGAIVSAEHRGNVTDPYAYDPTHYIRTKGSEGKPSSSYGPLQITYSTAKGFLDPKNPHHAAFLNQGKMFLSSPGTHETYGYGKPGTLGAEHLHDENIDVGLHVMHGKAGELKMDISKPLSTAELQRFLTHWRFGINNKEGRTIQKHDPKYWAHASGHYFAP